MLLFPAAEDMFMPTAQSIFRNTAEIGTFKKIILQKLEYFKK